MIQYKFKGILTTVAAIVVFCMPLSPALAQESSRAEALLQELQDADPAQADRLQLQLIKEWSKSGSRAMDLLLTRGRDAMKTGKNDIAIGHLTALTDHAPNFAEGWNALALAYFQKEMLGPAMDALERALALNPNHFGALRGVAAIYEQVNEPQLAYKAYKHVLSLNPHDADVIEALQRLETRAIGIEL